MIKKYYKFFLFFFILFLLPIKVFAYQEDKITLYLFHGDGCPHCAEEIRFLDGISDSYPNLEIVKYEVWNNVENSLLLDKVYDVFEIGRRGVPTTVIGSSVITGFGPTTSGSITRAIDFYLENEYVDVVSKIIDGSYQKEEEKVEDEFKKEEEKTDEEMTIHAGFFGDVNLKKMSLGFASVLIGMVDGFNPCTMWVLLFLISILIGMKNRRRMWILGLTFLLTSALFYLLIMLSWISVAVKITTIIWIRNLIAVIALIGGFINLYNFIKELKSDSGCSVVNDTKRKKIFSQIKKYVNEKSLFLALGGISLLAISVNLVELACSAGLPIVFSELLAINKVDSISRFMYTLLYVFFFLIDDLIIFLIAMITMKATGISTKYNKFSHLIGGLIMVVVGALLLFKPGLLMFNFS